MEPYPLNSIENSVAAIDYCRKIDLTSVNLTFVF